MSIYYNISSLLKHNPNRTATMLIIQYTFIQQSPLFLQLTNGQICMEFSNKMLIIKEKITKIRQLSQYN